MSILELACAADRGYVPHAAATIRSVLSHARPLTVRVHFLCDERFPERLARPLTEMVRSQGGQIDFLRIPAERIRGLPGWDYVSTAMWYRVLLPELLSDVERVLYLDDDTIAMDSLEPLWNVDVADGYLAAVTNVFMENDADRASRLGLPPTVDYFNSGVLLLNLDAMRRDGCTERLLEVARARAAHPGYPDQDALNLVLASRRIHLHPRWNCMNSVMGFSWSGDVLGDQAVAEARSAPGIRHFEGPGDNKPWHLLCRQPHREAYLSHRRQTPWPRVWRSGASPGAFFRLVRNHVARSREGRPARR